MSNILDASVSAAMRELSNHTNDTLHDAYEIVSHASINNNPFPSLAVSDLRLIALKLRAAASALDEAIAVTLDKRA